MRKEEDSRVAGVRIRMGRLGPHMWLDGCSHSAAAVDRCFMISHSHRRNNLDEEHEKIDRSLREEKVQRASNNFIFINFLFGSLRHQEFPLYSCYSILFSFVCSEVSKF